ncbi:MAG: hypothetical protein ACKO96_25860, partial [Flammeovirgaceae bacterium]
TPKPQIKKKNFMESIYLIIYHLVQIVKMRNKVKYQLIKIRKDIFDFYAVLCIFNVTLSQNIILLSHSH